MARFHAASSETQNVESGEGEHDNPQNVVGGPLWLAVESRDGNAKKQGGIGASCRTDCRRHPSGAGEPGNRRCCSR